jgi:hypothetical protein
MRWKLLKQSQCNREACDKGRGAQRHHDQSALSVPVQLLHLHYAEQSTTVPSPRDRVAGSLHLPTLHLTNGARTPPSSTRALRKPRQCGTSQACSWPIDRSDTRVSACLTCRSEYSLRASFYRASEAPRPTDADRSGRDLLEVSGHGEVYWPPAPAKEKLPCSMAGSLDAPSLSAMVKRKRALTAVSVRWLTKR